MASTRLASLGHKDHFLWRKPVFLCVLYHPPPPRGLVKYGIPTPTRPDAETPGLGSESADLTSHPADSEPGFPSNTDEG